MYLIVFGILFLVALALIIIGELIDPVGTVVGITLVFILGIIMLGGDLEYVTGQSVDYNYSYVNGSNTSVSTISQTTTDQYASLDDYTSHWFGFGLMAGSVFLFASIFFDLKRYIHKPKDMEEYR